jgi:hypothetical protein
MMAAIAAVIAITAICLWAVFGLIWWRALRTGRLLARGVIYDREGSPVRFWTGLIGMFVIVLIMTLCAVGLVADTVAKL